MYSLSTLVMEECVPCKIKDESRNAHEETAETTKDKTEKYETHHNDNRHMKYDRQAITDIIHTPVAKQDVFTTGRKKVSQLAVQLRRLSHDGDMSMMEKVVTAVKTNYYRRRDDMTRNVTVFKGMNLADMAFVALEAEVMSRRVMYDVSLSGSDVFKELEHVLPFTSNPTLSSMTYLARFGSAVAMVKTLDEGMLYLEYAKNHSSLVTPCMETGMVFYIEVNLLTQKYEENPTDEIKNAVLSTANTAIAQFTDEDPSIKRDFQRMLLLKMIFCHLGIGLFGNKINGIEVTNTDLTVSKKLFDFVERKDIWEGMEQRRQMLYFVAKAEFFRLQGMDDMSLMFGKKAVDMAKRNNWTKELVNILHYKE